MASKCIDDYINIKSDAVCVRPVTTYVNLHKWPVAEADFVRSITHGGSQRRTTVVDSISCRQMYLRSYTFSRKENEEDSDGGGSDNIPGRGNDRSCFGGGGRRKKAAKKAMRAFIFRLVWKCFSCSSTNVNNIDQ